MRNEFNSDTPSPDSQNLYTNRVLNNHSSSIYPKIFSLVRTRAERHKVCKVTKNRENTIPHEKIDVYSYTIRSINRWKKLLNIRLSNPVLAVTLTIFSTVYSRCQKICLYNGQYCCSTVYLTLYTVDRITINFITY